MHTTVVTTASTMTITPTPIAKRNADLDIDEVFQGFRREKEALNVTGMPDTPQLSASFSSACDCQNYAGTTTTATKTNSARVSNTFKLAYLFNHENRSSQLVPSRETRRRSRRLQQTL